MSEGEIKVIKKLPPSVVKDIELKNEARRMAGLSRIVITVRKCMQCGLLFESAGNRNCGCSSKKSEVAGSNII